MKKLVFCIGALAAALPFSVNADEPSEGIYLEGRGGLVLLQDADNEGSGIEIKSEFDKGFAAEGAVGYLHSSGIRGEIALGYRQNDVDDLVITNDGGIGANLGIGSLNGLSAEGAGVDVDGDASALTGLVNVFYEFQTGRVRPFVGAGIGGARIKADVEASAGGTTVEVVDDSDIVLAYQGTAGVVVDITENVAATASYSYFATSDPSLEDSAGASFDSEYQSHNVFLGIRFTM